MTATPLQEPSATATAEKPPKHPPMLPTPYALPDPDPPTVTTYFAWANRDIPEKESDSWTS